MKLDKLLILFAISTTFAYEVPNMYYIFQLEWPGTACEFNKCTKENVGSYTPDSWSIHGLWPSATSNKGDGCEQLEFCTREKFQQRSLSDITQKQLDKAWVGLYNPSPAFRSHEWSKHGSCWDEKDDLVPQLPGMTDQEEYFQTALELWRRYNVYNILKNHKIVPDYDNYYWSDDIKNALKKDIKTEVQLLCTKDSKNYVYLMSVSFCLDEQYTAIKCACPVFGGLPCGKYKNEKIYYIPFYV